MLVSFQAVVGLTVFNTVIHAEHISAQLECLGHIFRGVQMLSSMSKPSSKVSAAITRQAEQTVKTKLLKI